MKKFLLMSGLMLAGAAACAGQNAPAPPAPAPTATTGQTNQPIVPVGLERVLIEAEKQTEKYREVFRNLIAVETKRTETYDSKGEAEDQDTVEANFLVYQSSKDGRTASELRNVTKVNGKPIPESQTKSDQFFAELGKEKTLESELKKIEKESTKYARGLEVFGLTLNEGIVLKDNLRPYFDFTLQGTENFQGNQVYVVAYQQTRKSPYVTLNRSGGGEARSNEPNLEFNLQLPGALKKSDALLRGKLWIDAQSFQIRREERELTVAQAGAPIVLMTNIFEYQPSEYEILVPKQISLVTNEIKKRNNDYTAAREAKVIFDYSKFRKSNVEVVILDDDQ